MNDAYIARADDWVALYDSSGVKVTEGHSIPLDEAFRALGYTVKQVWAQGQADDTGGFPAQWSEVIPDE